MAVQQGRSERRGASSSCRTASLEAMENAAVFPFRILLEQQRLNGSEDCRRIVFPQSFVRVDI